MFEGERRVGGRQGCALQAAATPAHSVLLESIAARAAASKPAPQNQHVYYAPRTSTSHPLHHARTCEPVVLRLHRLCRNGSGTHARRLALCRLHTRTCALYFCLQLRHLHAASWCDRRGGGRAVCADLLPAALAGNCAWAAGLHARGFALRLASACIAMTTTIDCIDRHQCSQYSTHAGLTSSSLLAPACVMVAI